MNFYTDDHTIIACSTGTNTNTAIAVIRISGFKNLLDLQCFFSFSLLKIEARKSHLTNIIFNNKIYDNGLIVFFPEKNSYTGENVLEISVHGNQLNIQLILEVFMKEGDIKPAHPGEFTFRALRNKKLNLSQVEGLDLLLNANSSLMLSQGLDILQGDLHSQYLALYDAFLKLKAAIEISIDFSEDVGVEESQELFTKSFKHFFNLISQLKSRTEGNISAILSPEIVLVGQTNAGKSSLFNILLKHDRSIVSNIAGTTRDYISETIHIDGTNFQILDTAGIRDSDDVIENVGIERAMKILSRAFFKILIINPFESNPDYLSKFEGESFDLILFSHADKSDFNSFFSLVNLSKLKTKYVARGNFDSIESGSIGPIEDPLDFSGPIEPQAFPGPIEPLDFSGPIEPQALSGPIEPVLKSLILCKFNELTSHNPILLERHRDCINRIYLKTARLSSDINNISDSAILSSEVNLLGHSLTELVGIVTPDDVLNSIFSNFCIGK